MPESLVCPTGLTEREAAIRLNAEGPNELTHRSRRSFAAVMVDVLREPMLLLLLAGGIIYLGLGDPGEALMLLGFACFSVVITVMQETRSERALEALRDLASPRALVIRDGERRRIPGRDVVRGDLVVLSEGDRVPADGWVVENAGLALDESLLTGESAPVSKTLTDSGAGQIPRPGGDGLAYVFSGTLATAGSGLCHVAATGPRSEIGRIGQSLALIETQSPRLYRETRRVVVFFAIAGAVFSGLVALLYGLLRDGWLQAALAGIALAMAMIPEEFPVVLAVFLAMGAMRMSRVRVLARRAATIETLGAATVLCTDKTGTLTENRMRVAELRLPDGSVFTHDGIQALPPEFWPLIDLGILASAPVPFDPMEVAFHKLGEEQHKVGLRSRRLQNWDLRRHYGLDPALLAVSQAWNAGVSEDDHVIASKGAPEAIAELCGMNSDDRAAMREALDAMVCRNLRVLGIAEAVWRGSDLPTSPRSFAFRFRGLVGLEDPLRASVPEAVDQCRSAGIRVVMITGDHPGTALAIAQQAGIDAKEAVTGTALAAMSDSELARGIRDITVFARILPEQKLRIVQALKAQGEVVGMTGDGVNDAPSLKAADIGIAMGQRGTDVAREAAAIVLLNDDFGSIVTAVRVGRRIYDNLHKAMGFIVAVHIPVAGLALMPLLLGLPVLLGPVHIALLQMIIDPVCSLVFEAETEEPNIMRRRPRAAASRLLSPMLVGGAVVQGLLALGVVSAVVWLNAAAVENELRAAVFFSLIGIVLSLVLVNRSSSASITAAIGRPNLALVLTVLLVGAVCALVEWLPAVARILKLVALGWIGGVIAAGAGIVLFLGALGVKRLLPDPTLASDHLS